MHEFSVNASTDITGFGLLGHLYELCKASEVSAKIRSFRTPEPYKGKGIRYKDEYVKTKQGKTVGGVTA